MPRADHYAVLLGINTYPGLTNLEGPENDINAFEEWLLKTDCGDVPLENIRKILSSDFPATDDPNEANPTLQSFKRALNSIVQDSSRQWHERVGERLYLYLAGHGFMPGSSIEDPALYTAEARDGDTAHIAGLRFASRIRNAGFFEEVILIMDCCQGVLHASRVDDPTWAPPDRKMSGQVKFLEAYGAPRGKAAFERPVVPNGPSRGIFSKVLLEALNTAKADSGGYITGSSFKNQFLQIWDSSYKKETGYDPPIQPPAGQDIRLFKRTQGPALEPVEFLLTNLPPAAELEIFNGDGSLHYRVAAANLQPLTLPPGLYKARIPGTNRQALFEVTGASRQTVEL
jgi:hypothetical protein